MSFKKIVSVYTHAGGDIGTQLVDTGYTVPHGKVLIISNIGLSTIDSNGKIGNISIDYCFFSNNNKATGRGFIFTSGERIFFQIESPYSYASGSKFCGVLCGEEIPDA